MIPHVAHQIGQLPNINNPDPHQPPFETFSNSESQDLLYSNLLLPEASKSPALQSKNSLLYQKAHGVSYSPLTSTTLSRTTGYRLYTESYDPSEHMLRRKTPSGTLAAGYDGNPVQLPSAVPAMKRIVIPVSDSHPSWSDRPIPATPDCNLARQSHTIQQNQQNVPGVFIGVGWTDFNTNTAFIPPTVPTRLPSITNSHTNVWENLHMHETPMCNTDNRTKVPTVLQPAHQPSLHYPTASNDAGFYGPYWPDGRFIPYRPAAFQGHGHLFPGLESEQRRNYSMLYTGSALHQESTLGVKYERLERRGFYQTEHNSSLMYAQQSLPSSEPLEVHRRTHLSPLVLEDHRTTTVFTPDRVSTGHFKDKALSWAHSIYIDLLAFFQNSKTEDIYPNNSQNVTTQRKITIFPKSPLHTNSYPAPSLWSTRKWPNTPVLNDGEISERSTSNWRGASHLLQSSHGPNVSPLTKAKEALDILTRLCEQSGWSWIDGMLLGGCLAYGLDKHSEALEWYSKIVEIDSKHVEAISNIAATLLCLNRREEAEQHWLQSVRLRPSYFEAVEHLIGLLCTDHRGNEAINIIEFVQRSLRLRNSDETTYDNFSETSSNADLEAGDSLGAGSDRIVLDYDVESDPLLRPFPFGHNDRTAQYGFGSSGFAIPGSDNGRILALIHAKGNMLYALGDITAASKAFEDAVLISTGKCINGIHGLIRKIYDALSHETFVPLHVGVQSTAPAQHNTCPLLLPPNTALQTAKLVFTKSGALPGLKYVPNGLAKRAAISTTSNSLLSLAKIFQDGMSSSGSSKQIPRMPSGVGDILALYYLSLSLQPSPSTANNVGILLASVQQANSPRPLLSRDNMALPTIPGVVPGSGVALALAYYNYGLNLDSKHAHLYTNLGSLLKDIGYLGAAIKMYEQAVACDNTFDIALANLANAVKDQGRTSDAIEYYRRAVISNPNFAEAVCGLANALNSVCDWAGRGGVILDGGKQDRWHVDDAGMILEGRTNRAGGGWIKRVVDIVARQLREGASWGRGTLQQETIDYILSQLEVATTGGLWTAEVKNKIHATLAAWAGECWEGARVVRLIERATKRATHRWYKDKYIKRVDRSQHHYRRPRLPTCLSIPSAPTVLPFHTFTCPLSAKDIRMISQRNALRISCSTLRASWMPWHVFPPPPPPSPHLNIGYVSSDFNNHPLAHLMQSVFGLHDISRAKAFCYATTDSDNSVHRLQIEAEAPVFRNASAWSAEQLVQQIVQDGIHILVNLNGYTRGARNEIFAARPAPIQMSFMGFAGTLGAEWCDYILADEIAIPPDTLCPWRRNVDIEDQFLDEQSCEKEDWVYSENVIFCRDTFFCCDHAQSELQGHQVSWEEEQTNRWKMRKELFPKLSDDVVILGNFNQLYKIEPTTFRTWLRILDKVPNAILWLLRFPDLGENNLKRTALDWAGEEVASRIWFTDVAPKHQHISRARVCDLFLDTPECNAHTTAADVLWSSTPLLTLPRYRYKMCSRMAASILRGALPKNEEGRRAAADLIARDDEDYENIAVRLANGLSYKVKSSASIEGSGRLWELRKLLYDSKWTCALFDTKRWVADLERGYIEAWRRWVADIGGDIYL